MNESIPEKPTLLDAVRKVVAENGGERPTMKQLVEGSHIPERGFNKYFPKATLRAFTAAFLGRGTERENCYLPH